MKPIDRVRRALAGEALDRPPYAFWTHLPGIDLDPARLAAATVALRDKFALDFVKSMPNGLYCVEDWGVECDYSGIAAGGVARVTRYGIRAREDWATLARLAVDRGALGRELDALTRVIGALGPDVPVLATVFSPVTIAAKLAGPTFHEHLASAPGLVRAGLDTITDVTCRFTQAAIARGCAGVFFALQDATPRSFSRADYRAQAEPLDRRVATAASEAGGWFNVLHAHGEDLHFDLLADYPVDALNWHIGETPPTIAAYRRAGGVRPILGGLQRAHLTACDRPAVRADIDSAMAATGGRGLLLAPACVIRHPVDDAMLDWTARAIRALAA